MKQPNKAPLLLQIKLEKMNKIEYNLHRIFLLHFTDIRYFTFFFNLNLI